MSVILFLVFALVAVVCAVNVVVQTHPISSAISLVGVMGSLAALYLLLGAEFIAAVQLIVYAGAIMVLFLFVVMLLNVPREDASEWDRAHPLYKPWPMRIGAVLAILLVAQLGWALLRTPGISEAIGADSAGVTNVGELGRVLFTDYMFAFEVTSILIISAMVGAVILARKQTE